MPPVAVHDPSVDANYDTVDENEIAYVEIFPPLGIARLGDSTTQYFFAPEVPGRTDPPTPDGNFRDGQQRIRRQAVRFRVYAYNGQHEVLEELNSKNGYKLTWTVRVKNMKPAYTVVQNRYQGLATDLRNPDVDADVDADIDPDVALRLSLATRTNLIVDSQEQTITRTGDPTAPVELRGDFHGSNDEATSVYMGELHVDNKGRLVFLGGRGHAECVQGPVQPHPEIISDFNSKDWIDDTCDGWVKVKVTKGTWTKQARHAAAVLSAPPKFAWGVECPTSLYDVMENIYKPAPAETTADFYEHIWPVLSGTYGLSWVDNQAFQGHGPFGRGNFLPMKDRLANRSAANKQLREAIFLRLRKPNHEGQDQATAKYMPRLSGDGGDLVEPGVINTDANQIRNFAALTSLQYRRFELWKDGAFTAKPYTPPIRIENVTKGSQPRFLTRAILEQVIGDPLAPGIEVWWIAKLDTTYDRTITHINPPFRIKPTVEPGHLTGGLSIPWHSDFDLCDIHWWPSVRPDDVVRKAEFDTARNGAGDPAKNFAKALTRRRKWKRGLRITPADPVTFPGSTDMVKFWNYLGFVKKHNTVANVYVESERLGLPNP